MCEKCAYFIDGNLYPMWTQIPNSYLPKLLPFYLHSAGRETLQLWEHKHDVTHQAQQLLDFLAVLLILYLFFTCSDWLIRGCCKKNPTCISRAKGSYQWLNFVLISDFLALLTARAVICCFSVTFWQPGLLLTCGNLLIYFGVHWRGMASSVCKSDPSLLERPQGY